MIGLGSNRLTVCRRGGMSVTQAGRGGMEWLGSRAPLWSQWWLPYSRQAGEALLAQFPTQWPTIQDYGFAHPEIVGYMNAYAPEDAKIAYSLVEGLGLRYCVGDGHSYFDTWLSMPNGFRVTLKLLYKDGNRAPGLVGSHNQNSPYQRNFIGSDNYKTIVSYGNTYESGSISFETDKSYLIDASTSKLGSYFKVDGEYSNALRTHTEDETTRTLKIYAHGYNLGQGTYESMSGMDDIVIYESDNTTIAAKFIPFKRNGVMELLDLVSGNLATRVGTFTELIESPS